MKVCAELRSLIYEVCEGDTEELKELEDLIDEITGKALGTDMSGCLACAEDHESKDFETLYDIVMDAPGIRQSGQAPSEEV